MNPAVSVERTAEGASVRLPSLDGVRAFCIGLVAFAHVMGTRGFPMLPTPYPAFWGSLTAVSVRTFFLISGFLITTILLNERRRTARVSIAVFYFRRTLRLFPALYVYILAVGLAQHFGWVDLKRGDLLALATFTTNYHRDRSWYTGHAWSLGIEEQFYLLWPLAIKLLAEKNMRRLTWVIVAVAPLIRVALYRFAPSFRAGIGETYPTVADILATGSLLALVRKQLGEIPRYLAFLQSRLFWTIPILVLALAVEPSEGLRFLVGETIMNVGIAVMVDRFTRFSQLPSGRALNWPPLVTIGMASYSLFLWQQPFLNRGAGTSVSRFPLNLAVAIAIGFFSYRFIEQPLGRLRRRWERDWGLRRAGNRAGANPPAAA